MYFNNAFGGGQGGASALMSPPDNTLASLFQQHQQPRPGLGGPQIPQNGARQMNGVSMPNMMPSPLSQGSGSTSTPQSTDLMAMLQKYGIGGGQGGMGGGLGGGAMGSQGSLLDMSSFLKRLFGGGSQATGDPINLMGNIGSATPQYGGIY